MENNIKIAAVFRMAQNIIFKEYNQTDKVFYTKKELLAILPISEATLGRYVKENLAPFNKRIKVKRRVFFPADIIEELKGLTQEIAKSPKS